MPVLLFRKMSIERREISKSYDTSALLFQHLQYKSFPLHILNQATVIQEVRKIYQLVWQFQIQRYFDNLHHFFLFFHTILSFSH